MFRERLMDDSETEDVMTKNDFHGLVSRLELERKERKQHPETNRYAQRTHTLSQ